MEETATTLDFVNIHFSESQIIERKKNKVTLTVPKSEISRIQLKKGLAAERPIVQFVFGIIFAIPGVLLLPGLYLWIFEGGTLYVDVILIFLLIMPLGFWLSITAMRRRYFLHIEMESDSRKVEFPRGSALREIKDFLTAVGSKFGFEFEHQV